MSLKLLVLLCTSYAAFVHCHTTTECFPNATNSDLNDDDWRYDPPTARVVTFPPFDQELESSINKQINAELSAHYAYLSMSYYFDQDYYYMPGFSKFFKKMAEEEHEHAQMFMKYQNKRGGRVRLHNIVKPCDDGNWGNGTTAMKTALNMEKKIYDYLLALHTAASAEGSQNAQLLDFLESNFLGEQVESIKELSNYVHTLQRLHGDNGLGEYQFDKLTLGGGKDS